LQTKTEGWGKGKCIKRRGGIGNIEFFYHCHQLSFFVEFSKFGLNWRFKSLGINLKSKRGRVPILTFFEPS
jgi:hypothetical protein